MDEFNIRIDYKPKGSSEVKTQVYEFRKYAEMLRNDMLHIIGDVENLIREESGKEDRGEWDAQTQRNFEMIRHRVLDCANAVRRMPDNLYYGDMHCNQISLTNWVTKMFELQEKAKNQ